MMAVGDVQRRNSPECRDERITVDAADRPDRVPDEVGRLEIEERRGERGSGRESIDLGRRAVGQEHGTGLRHQRDHVTRAVVFLVSPRPFVFLDDAAVVFVEREATCQANLLVRAHPETVEVHAGRLFDDKRGVLELREIFRRAPIHRGRVRIGPVWQVDLRSRHAQEAERLAFRKLSRLGCRNNVVGYGRDPRRLGGPRTQRTEWIEGRHNQERPYRSDHKRSAACRSRASGTSSSRSQGHGRRNVQLLSVTVAGSLIRSRQPNTSCTGFSTRSDPDAKSASRSASRTVGPYGERSSFVPPAMCAIVGSPPTFRRSSPDAPSHHAASVSVSWVPEAATDAGGYSAGSLNGWPSTCQLRSHLRTRYPGIRRRASEARTKGGTVPRSSARISAPASEKMPRTRSPSVNCCSSSAGEKNGSPPSRGFPYVL